ncbi:MAG: hypothetical protein COV78_04810 [Candidatus Pacebacteria bacterium CG11_big_fil_rev_8_21_14_0_20_34_55]|nr:MAG: hypothetical protein COV78_04810 [Candidatus Pacebacteria bacterium CG11_big_fil_rev_8_21_14_0_20_34_55]
MKQTGKIQLMAKNDKYHIISRNEGWAVKREGSSRAAGVYSTKDAATRASDSFRNQSHDVVVHKADGTISEWRKGKK